MQLERILKERVRRDLKTLRRAWFFKSNESALRGIPDYIVCIASYFVALELKRDARCKANPLQAYVLRKIENTAGGVAVVVHPDNWGEIFQLLQKIDAGVCPSVLLNQASLYEKPA